MTRRRFLLLTSILLLLAAVTPLIFDVRSISGYVNDETGIPITDATVRIKSTNISTTTNNQGYFNLSGFSPAFKIHITAWKDGYYVRGRVIYPWNKETEIKLAPFHTTDNQDYSWVPPTINSRSASNDKLIQAGLYMAQKLSFNRIFIPLSEKLTLGCSDCHKAIYQEWASSNHSLGNQNILFMTMYNGTDTQRRQSPPTPLSENRFYYGGLIPTAPNEKEQYYGPGFKLDFPDISGNCAACHLPAAATNSPYETDPNIVVGNHALGSHCDFCHKILSVKLDQETGLPPQNLPGILAINLARPGEQQIFFGPFDDVDVGPDTFLPLMRQSQLCAPCHNASFWNVPIYQSFAEWLESPYSEKGITCQDCHMAPSGSFTNFAPDRGGAERDPNHLATHDFPGATDLELLQNSVSLESWVDQTNDQINLTVKITNDNTGHHIPTDSPLRHLILLIQATDEEGSSLEQINGPILPDWCGIGNPEGGYYAGLPGTAYGKILEELWTGFSPSGSYWTPTRILSDNRIPAFGSDSTSYSFSTPVNGKITIEITLIYRRAFIDLINIKGWNVPDIPIKDEMIIINQ